MKKILFLLVVFCSLHTNAQTYSISFSGSGLSTVKVQNLTSGVIVDVSAGDDLLLSIITGIPEVNNLKSSGLKVYPNPMTDRSTLEILPPVAGDAIISVCDMTGRVLTQYNGYLENYTQEFSLSCIENGLQIITVQGDGYRFSEKLLSNGKYTGTANIVRISNNIQAVAEKKSIMDSKGIQGNVDMAYTTGEILKYTAVSGNNKTVMTDVPTADKTITFTFTECKDGDNNYYPVVQIGTQLWMEENLKTTSYKDGTAIPNITDNTAWAALTTGAYSDYDNTPANSAIYGRLYNWYAADNNAATKMASNGGKNVCPTGWHMPGDDEWTTLTTYLGGEAGAGGKLKETNNTHWNSQNLGATNETGFTALPGGIRFDYGLYLTIGDFGDWWSSTEVSTTNAWLRGMFIGHADVVRGNSDKNKGYSVLCVRQANSQYSISFSGTGLSAVKVQNLTTDVIVDVPAGDVLLLSTPTAIPEVKNVKSSEMKADVEKKSLMSPKGIQATVDMAYTDGEILKYTAVSGNYSTIMTDIPYGDKTVTFTFTECKDGDNNYYPVVQIGPQLWMAENLKTTSYNDGTAIPNITDNTAWATLTTGAYSDYDNTPANSTIYGRLYNWYAADNNVVTKVASNGGKNVCPTNWHVPSNQEWIKLELYLGGLAVAGGKLKETGTTHWEIPNTTSSTNETGFTALPGGIRNNSTAGFDDIGSFGNWYSSTENYATRAFILNLNTFTTVAGPSSMTCSKQAGLSVRCVRD